MITTINLKKIGNLYLLEAHNLNKNKNEKQINNIGNSSIMKYNSKYNNHFYFNSNNKKKYNNPKKDLINLKKNKNSQSKKIMKKVISKLINKKKEQKLNAQNINKKENIFEMLNNALNEVNKKIKYIKNK